MMRSHGRDNKLLVWQLKPEDESSMGKTLPFEGEVATQGSLWLLYTLHVNALNFCPFAMCFDGMPPIEPPFQTIEDGSSVNPILVAVPNAMDSGGVGLPGLAESSEVLT